MVIPRSVHARLVERLIFNFRVKPDALKGQLPMPWLDPQIINGWSVVSFCILNLDQMMISPLPGAFGYKTISCAYRCGVIDRSGATPVPSVYITDRNSDLSLIARFAPFLFLDTILMIRPQIDENDDGSTTVRVHYNDKQRLFEADAKPAPSFTSSVFGSIDEFKQFIHFGVSSFAPSIYGNALTKVDLYKEDPVYSPLQADVHFSSLDGVWSDIPLEFDSAVHAAGGIYRWTYRGLVFES